MCFFTPQTSCQISTAWFLLSPNLAWSSSQPWDSSGPRHCSTQFYIFCSSKSCIPPVFISPSTFNPLLYQTHTQTLPAASCHFCSRLSTVLESLRDRRTHLRLQELSIAPEWYNALLTKVSDQVRSCQTMSSSSHHFNLRSVEMIPHVRQWYFDQLIQLSTFKATWPKPGLQGKSKSVLSVHHISVDNNAALPPDSSTFWCGTDTAKRFALSAWLEWKILYNELSEADSLIINMVGGYCIYNV